MRANIYQITNKPAERFRINFVEITNANITVEGTSSTIAFNGSAEDLRALILAASFVLEDARLLDLYKSGALSADEHRKARMNLERKGPPIPKLKELLPKK